MKSNLISAIAGWKSAALLALVAMVAAVAFSGVLTTPTADAHDDDDTDTVDAVPGQTVSVSFSSTDHDGTRFRISSDSVGDASFVANGSTAIRCVNDSHVPPNSTPNCDVLVDDGGDNNDVIRLLVKVEDDSPLGEIFVQQTTRSAGEVTVQHEITITVARPDPPTAIQLVGLPPASVNMDGSAARDVTVRLVKGDGTGVVGQSLNVISTSGALNTDGSGACAAAADAATAVVSPRAFCTVATIADDDTTSAVDEAGRATISVFGAGVPGTAELTFSLPAHGLTLETAVVLHGAAADITAVAEQSSIQIGGGTNIVVTVVDAAGNPIPSQGADVAMSVFNTPRITPPETPQSVAAVAVIGNKNLDKNVGDPRYNIPACGDQAEVADDPDTDVDESTLEIQDAGAGTNGKGQCVINVRAPLARAAGGTDNASATRGTHSITVVADNLVGKPDPKEVTIEIHVGGAPATIETDAPARVDSLSSTAITVTVLDDEGVRVGAVGYSIDQIEGEGKITSGETDDESATKDGQAKFTYRAPRAGTALFLVTVPVGQSEISHTVEVAVGPAPEEAPDAPPATWNAELVSGTHNLVWNGEDGADPADGAGEGVTAIWQWNGSSWDGYFPAAADVPGGNTLDSLSNGAAYWVIVE